MKYVKLFESYQSQKELEKLVSDILKKINDKTLSDFNDKVTKYKFITFNEIEVSEYALLKDFLIDFKDLEIHPLLTVDFRKYSNDNAIYIAVKNKDNSIGRLILLNITVGFISDVNEYIDEFGIEKAFVKSEEKLNLYYSSELLHELQHAYDDWRRKGNLDKVKYDSKNLDFKSYINNPFEVDARFAEAIKKTKFYRDDWEAKFSKDLDLYEMIPFEEVYKEFLNNLDHTKHLNDEHRKRLLRKFGQFYEKEKDFVANYNKNKEIVK
jgi:hypothetical protein